MGATQRKPPLIAVDTNVLLDLAGKNESAWNCLEALRLKRPKPRFIVTPTVLQELAHLFGNGKTAEERKLAAVALQSLLAWGFEPLNLLSVGHGIVEIIGDELRAKGLLPQEERHDSFVIAEAALCDADVLVSSDTALTSIDHQTLHVVLSSFDVKSIIITWPRRVVKLLGGK